MINSLALHTDSEEEIGGKCCRLGRQTNALRSLCASPSVLPHGTTRRKLDGFSFYLMILSAIAVTWHEDLHTCTFIIMSRSFLLRMKIASIKVVEKIGTHAVHKIGTHAVHKITFFFESRAICEIMRENILQQDRRMYIACWIPEATNTDSEYVILLLFLRQQ